MSQSGASQDDVRLNVNMNTNNYLRNGNMNNNTGTYGSSNNYVPPNQLGSNRPSNSNLNGGYYSTGMGGPASIVSGAGTIGPGGVGIEPDNKSITSTPSKISKLTYSEYPQIRPTNPLYTSTATIKTATSAASRASTMNTVSRRQKYNPNAPRRINDWRWVAALAVLLFFPTGIIAIGLAFKARTKFEDGFIDDAKKLNKRAYLLCIASFILGLAWILTAFFMIDKWPRTNG